VLILNLKHMGEFGDPMDNDDTIPSVETSGYVIASIEHPNRCDDRAIRYEALNGRIALIGAMDGVGSGGAESSIAAGKTTVCAREMMDRLTSIPSVEEGKELLGEALMQARDMIQAMPEHIEKPSADTVACFGLMCESDGKRFLVVANVGDARMYRITHKGYEQISRDHSVLQGLLEIGYLSPMETFENPRRNIISKTVGSLKKIEDINFDVVEIKEGDYYLCVSDGFSDNFPPGQIAEVFWKELANKSSVPIAERLALRAQNVQIRPTDSQYTRPDYAKPDDIAVVVLKIPRKK